MAKEEKTKTDYIREALAKWPELSTTEIAKKLEAHGISMAYVSSIKSMDAKKAKKKRRRQASPKSRSRRVVSMTALRKAKEFAAEAGGLNQARLLLDLLDELK